MKDFSRFQNKKIAILWYGREWAISLQFLLKIGVLPKDITILDATKKIEGLIVDLAQITTTMEIDPDFNIVLWNTYLDDLKTFDIIIKTPWVSLYHEKVYPHRDKITSQAQIFFDYYQGKIIAVSGTKGKSTTSTLIYKLLENAQKKVQLIGNIGNPVLDYLEIKDLESQKEEYAVFEISSYMLEGLRKSNYISILLNIYSDHTDRHKGFENYKDAKLNILKGSEHNLVRDEVVEMYNIQKKEIKALNGRIFGHVGSYTHKDHMFFSENKEIFNDKNIVLQWEHNMMNISAVLGFCNIMHIDYKVLEDTLEKFEGLPHRMEKLWIYGGISWIDDAISTTPESTIQAIKTFGDQIDTIFLWGTDRDYVFDELVKVILEYGIRNVVLFPDSGRRIYDAIKKRDSGEINIFQTKDMKDAVKFAYKYTKIKKICILSTASPSYSLRKNFEEKGDLFYKHIKELS